MTTRCVMGSPCRPLIATSPALTMRSTQSGAATPVQRMSPVASL
jgi:hypothetical protein